MKKTFTIKPLGGLCNCLRVLLSCADYCDNMGYDLLCVWNSWQNNVNFTDFFKNIKGLVSPILIKAMWIMSLVLKSALQAKK